jgi:hypothetical protein
MERLPPASWLSSFSKSGTEFSSEGGETITVELEFFPVLCRGDVGSSTCATSLNDELKIVFGDSDPQTATASATESDRYVTVLDITTPAVSECDTDFCNIKISIAHISSRGVTSVEQEVVFYRAASGNPTLSTAFTTPMPEFKSNDLSTMVIDLGNMPEVSSAADVTVEFAHHGSTVVVSESGCTVEPVGGTASACSQSVLVSQVSMPTKLTARVFVQVPDLKAENLCSDDCNANATVVLPQYPGRVATFTVSIQVPVMSITNVQPPSA